MFCSWISSFGYEAVVYDITTEFSSTTTLIFVFSHFLKHNGTTVIDDYGQNLDKLKVRRPYLDLYNMYTNYS